MEAKIEEHTCCPACGAPIRCCKPWLVRDAYHLLECQGCEHRFVRERIPPGTLTEYYDEEYFREDVYLDYDQDPRLPQQNFARYGSRIGAHHSGGVLVEFGSAYGFFLDLANHYTGYGVEISKRARESANARGHRVVEQAHELPVELEGAVDVVAMWDTIEHLSDLEGVFADVSRLLKPGGGLYLTTGDAASWFASRRGHRWRLIDPPQHLHYFTPRSLVALGTRFELDLIDVDYLPHTRSIAFMLNLLGRRREGRMGSALQLASRLTPRRLRLSLNFRDIMFARLVRR